MNDYGIVEIFPFADKEKSKCGYCKAKTGSLSYGMWCHSLTVQNFQDLTERGWRRSGLYCYKPDMKETCCPQYTIRCDVAEFQLSKSQKSVLRRMRQFLITGNSKSNEQAVKKAGDEQMDVSPIAQDNLTQLATMVQCSNEEVTKISKKNVIRGADPDRPQCRKAKLIRMERKLEKMSNKSQQPLSNTASTSNKAKSVTDHVDECLPPNAKHTLKIITVRPSRADKRFNESFSTVFALYKKYQMAVHHDKPDKCTTQQFQRFLVDSPLVCEEPDDDDDDADDDALGYGSFHQQYWMDDNLLIAVGVIDVLPTYVSSVYFFYDPDYSFLSLGHYGALREIAFTQQLKHTHPDMQFYLMGFYIHSCIKMRYKGQYRPSFLLCPETFTWQPIEEAKKKLDVVKYSRLADNPNIVDEEAKIEEDDVMILYKRNVMTYSAYLERNKIGGGERRDINTYAAFVGRKAAKHILLYRS